MLPAIALGLTAPYWVQILLGIDWDPVGSILQILLLTFMLSFIVSLFQRY